MSCRPCCGRSGSTFRRRSKAVRSSDAILALLLLAPIAGTRAGEEPLDRIEADRARLDSERRALEGREEGVLEDLRRLESELTRAQGERDRLTEELRHLSQEIELHERRLADVSERQEERRRYLAFRIREQYKDGPDLALRRLASRESEATGRAGARIAAYLSDRDARTVAEYRIEVGALAAARESLVARRAEQAARRAAVDTAERRISSTRSDRETLLERIRDDRATREAAIAELERAARELSERIGSLESGADAPTLDVRKFRGLLDWPADGRVGAGFGERIHPRFRTSLPHPGLDIQAPSGTEIRSVFDGRVVYAAWMRGYGLTAIIDHGGGLLSVYAHAAVLLVETGETVVAGGRIGAIGDTGSLSGPLLYFEIRDSGRPVDPAEWLRPRQAGVAGGGGRR